MNANEARKLLASLGIEKLGKMKGKRYIVDIPSSDDYARFYTILDRNDNLELGDTSSISTEYVNVLSYYLDDYKISLNANFKDDYYNLVVEEVE